MKNKQIDRYTEELNCSRILHRSRAMHLTGEEEWADLEADGLTIDERAELCGR